MEGMVTGRGTKQDGADESIYNQKPTYRGWKNKGDCRHEILFVCCRIACDLLVRAARQFEAAGAKVRRKLLHGRHSAEQECFWAMAQQISSTQIITQGGVDCIISPPHTHMPGTIPIIATARCFSSIVTLAADWLSGFPCRWIAFCDFVCASSI